MMDIVQYRLLTKRAQAATQTRDRQKIHPATALGGRNSRQRGRTSEPSYGLINSRHDLTWLVASQDLSWIMLFLQRTLWKWVTFLPKILFADSRTLCFQRVVSRSLPKADLWWSRWPRTSVQTTISIMISFSHEQALIAIDLGMRTLRIMC